MTGKLSLMVDRHAVPKLAALSDLEVEDLKPRERRQFDSWKTDQLPADCLEISVKPTDSKAGFETEAAVSVEQRFDKILLNQLSNRVEYPLEPHRSWMTPRDIARAYNAASDAHRSKAITIPPEDAAWAEEDLKRVDTVLRSTQRRLRTKGIDWRALLEYDVSALSDDQPCLRLRDSVVLSHVLKEAREDGSRGLKRGLTYGHEE